MERRQYDNTNSGVIFKNNRKEQPNHPDFTGHGNFEGTEVWINGWRKSKQDGEQFISFSFKRKEPKPGAQAAASPAAKPAVKLDDEIPF